MSVDRTLVRFGAAGIDAIGFDDAIDRIMALARRTGEGESVVVTPNIDHLVSVHRIEAVARTYDRAELVLADGQPLVMWSKLLRLPLREKVSGSDLIVPMLQAAADRDVPVFFFGSTDEVVAEAERRLADLAPALRVVGRTSPFYSVDDPETPEVLDAIEQVRSSGAQLVVLALGAPKQECFLDHFHGHLGDGVWLCLGASLDFVAGKVSRAPQWMRRTGTEWIYRLIQEPGRMWRRYLVRDVAAIPILLRMLWARLRGRSLVDQRSGGH